MKSRSKRYKIDKSVLTYGTRPKVIDEKYRASFRNRVCIAASGDGFSLCGLPSVGAHIRAGEYAGVGTKPSDDLILPLCDRHHREQEASPGAEWFLENIVKPMARRMYREFKNGK